MVLITKGLSSEVSSRTSRLTLQGDDYGAFGTLVSPTERDVEYQRSASRVALCCCLSLYPPVPLDPTLSPAFSPIPEATTLIVVTKAVSNTPSCFTCYGRRRERVALQIHLDFSDHCPRRMLMRAVFTAIDHLVGHSWMPSPVRLIKASSNMMMIGWFFGSLICSRVTG